MGLIGLGRPAQLAAVEVVEMLLDEVAYSHSAPQRVAPSSIFAVRRQEFFAGQSVALLLAGGKVSCRAGGWMAQQSLWQQAAAGLTLAAGLGLVLAGPEAWVQALGVLVLLGVGVLVIERRGALRRRGQQIQTDITELGDRLERQRDRNAAVLNLMDAAVLLLDRQQRVRWMNARAIQLFGRRDQGASALHRPLIEVIRHPSVHEVVRAESGDRVEEFDLPGPVRRVMIARATDDKTRDGTILVIQEVTKLRRLETIRRDFMANLGHELRTPIAVARAQGENLADGVLRDPEAVQRAGAAVVRAADRLAGMVGDLRDLANIETGRSVGELVPVSLSDVVAHTFASLRSRADDKNFTMVSTVPEGLCLRADAHAMERLLINLVDNAIQNGADGGRVELSARARGGQVEFSVKDDGPGIPEHLHDRIFERFFRSSGDRSPRYQGTGLGLAIVKHLVAAMEGQIALDSSPGQGAAFTLTFDEAREDPR